MGRPRGRSRCFGNLAHTTPSPSSAGLAQLAERIIRNDEVGGSRPSIGTSFTFSGGLAQLVERCFHTAKVHWFEPSIPHQIIRSPTGFRARFHAEAGRSVCRTESITGGLRSVQRAAPVVPGDPGPSLRFESSLPLQCVGRFSSVCRAHHS